MKKVFYLLFVLGVLSFSISSCTKNEEPVKIPVVTHSGSGNGVLVTDYCEEIDDWAEANYPDATIDSVLLVTYSNPQSGEDFQEYVLYLSNGVTAGFDADTCEFLWETCPTEYDPVCWENNTYNNLCEAIQAGADSSDVEAGACCTDDCSEDFNPVCWNDVTYENECVALCAGAVASEITPGACSPCEDDCSDEYVPVCWNGVNYDNECLALCDGAVASEITQGICGGDCINDAISNTFPTATVVSIVSGYSNVGYGNAFYAVTLDFSGAEVVVYFDEDCNYYTMCDCDTTVDIQCAGSTNYLNNCEAECQAPGETITSGPCS